MSDIKINQRETEKQQCTETAAIGHLGDLSRTNLGSARKLAMFVDETAPELHSSMKPQIINNGRDAFKWEAGEQKSYG